MVRPGQSSTEAPLTLNWIITKKIIKDFDRGIELIAYIIDKCPDHGVEKAGQAENLRDRNPDKATST